MRIGIDARLLGARGLGRVVEQLLHELASLHVHDDFFIFVNDDYESVDIPDRPNFHIISAPYAVYGLAEQILFPLMLRKYKLDIMHFPHFNVPLLYRRPFIVTVHDLILLKFPTTRATTLGPITFYIKYWMYRIVIRSALRRARVITTVSHTSKRDITENFNVDDRKIHVVYNGLTRLNSGKDIERLVEGPYILYVGSAYPHKNLEMLIDAYDEMTRKTSQCYSLVLTGGEDYFYQRLNEYASKKECAHSIIFWGHSTNDELTSLYAHAELVVSPSLYEGFGLTPLEALQFGVPSLITTHSCFPEIMGKSAMYADTDSVDSYVRSLSRALVNRKWRDSALREGLTRVSRYSWTRMAEIMYALYTKEK